MSPTASPILVTGANGHLGRNLIRALAGEREVRAVVRSERAAQTLKDADLPLGLSTQILDPSDVDALARAAEGCGAWVHLVGILKESSRASYAEAHERSCERVAQAAGRAGVGRIVYPSILGSRPDAACVSTLRTTSRIGVIQSECFTHLESSQRLI